MDEIYRPIQLGDSIMAAVLDEKEVRVIKYFLERGVERRRIAHIYGLAAETIARIARGDTWAYVKAMTAEEFAEMEKGYKHGKA